MAGEVAAINRRYVLREKGLERFCVVPVEEVAVKLAQLRHRGKRQFLTLDKLERTDVSKIVRGDSGE